MKACWTRLLGFFLVFSIPVSAGILETIEFDIDKLQVDPASRSIRYGELEPIQDAGFPAIPAARHFYHAETIIAGANISAIVMVADTVDPGFIPALNAADLATSDIEFPVTQPVILAGGNNLYPGQPIKIIPQTVKGRSLWSVMVFPIQYLDDGRFVFNRIVEIRTEDDDAACGIKCGLPPEDAGASLGPAYLKTLSPADGNGCPLGQQYLVVTSPELAEAFGEFVDLKLRTGYDAALALTDSIFACYSGLDEAEALRNYLKDFYHAGGEYVLLGGDENQVPIRYAYFYNTETVPALDQLMICDLYFADYDGDWDADGDGVWGEPIGDRPDLGTEISLGRLPFSRPDQVETYTEKLKSYLFNPGGGDRQYLNRAVFFTSDQMVDYFGDQGQQYYVAEKFPSGLEVDCDRLAEAPSGIAPSPSGPFPPEAVADLDNGYGLINILAHGRPDGFILNSSEYNLFPKSYLLTGEEHIGAGAFDDLAASQKIGFYYSISCMQAAIDLEKVYDMTVPSVVEKLLDLDSAGAVGIIGFSRWGWVGSSYRLMASFYEHLFGDADGYPVAAMDRTYLDYPYYLDQIYGQNYYGDPSLRLYLNLPPALDLTTADNYYNPLEPIYCRLVLDGEPMAEHPAVARIGDDEYLSLVSDGDGYIALQLPKKCSETVEITASFPGAVSTSVTFYPSIAADADDDQTPLPEIFELRQNYPNPFNPATTIGFTLTRYQPVTLQVFDILGRLIDCPLDGILPAGEHHLIWNGTDADGRALPSGMYFYRLISEEGTAVRKMILVK